MSKKLKIGITHGDINGISYEVIIKALSDNRILDLCTPVIYGNAKIITYYKNSISDIGNFFYTTVDSASSAQAKKVNLVNCIDEENPKINVGESTAIAGQYALASLNMAMKDLASGVIDAVVTAPINKSNMQSDQFDFVGHTEYFAANDGKTPLMLMINERVKVGLVSIHEPLVKVTSRVTAESIMEKLKLMKESLTKDFAIVNPKIAVLSLNPHAGDCGLLGKEEQDIVIPAIKKARDSGICAFGPFAADGFFGSGMYKKYDATLAMFHDQGLTPFKLISELGGVNYTAGLTIVRTSPAHGVGYDIAGKDLADPTSFREAIYAAIDIVRNREIHAEISANPLPIYSRDTWGKDTSVSDISAPQAENY